MPPAMGVSDSVVVNQWNVPSELLSGVTRVRTGSFKGKCIIIMKRREHTRTKQLRKRFHRKTCCGQVPFHLIQIAT